MVGAAAIAAVIWGERAALRRLKRKRARRKPKTRELVTRLNFNLAPMTESMLKASEAMRKMQQVMGHVHCRVNWDSVIGATPPEPAGPPTILCSSCGDTLERNGDHFDCTGCGRQVGP